MRNETRFRMVEKLDAERFRRLAAAARDGAARRVALYEQLSRITFPVPGAGRPAGQDTPEKAVAR
jgi:hypothetical protein